VVNPGSGEPWEWWTLGVVYPGSGEPWEWRAVTIQSHHMTDCELEGTECFLFRLKASQQFGLLSLRFVISLSVNRFISSVSCS